MIRFILNTQEIDTQISPATLLLDFIRYQENLKGTKIGCREGDCGACTVLMGDLIEEDTLNESDSEHGSGDGKKYAVRYRSVTSCLVPLGNIAGKHIVSVEGLNLAELNAIQKAFCDEGATQCGFCTPGFIVSLAGGCLQDEPELRASIDGNICRCTGYKSIERAVEKLNLTLASNTGQDKLDFAIENDFLPVYFKSIPGRLSRIRKMETFDGGVCAGQMISGGTDLYVQQPEELHQKELHFLFNRKDLRAITAKDDFCKVGASVTVTDLLESEIIQSHFPKIRDHFKLVSSTQIRNIATVGGNIVNASPIADLTIFFLALNAELVLFKENVRRSVLLKDFYNGYKQLNKEADEIVESVRFRLPSKDSFFNFEKVSKRTWLDIASVNSALCIAVRNDVVENAQISAGGVAPIPMLLQQASNFLKGKSLSEEVVLDCIHLAQTEVQPISDVRGSAEYKRLLLSQLIKAHFIELFPELSVKKILEAVEY